MSVFEGFEERRQAQIEYRAKLLGDLTVVKDCFNIFKYQSADADAQAILDLLPRTVIDDTGSVIVEADPTAIPGSPASEAAILNDDEVSVIVYVGMGILIKLAAGFGIPNA